jgi:hypothetical protein
VAPSRVRSAANARCAGCSRIGDHAVLTTLTTLFQGEDTHPHTGESAERGYWFRVRFQDADRGSVPNGMRTVRAEGTADLATANVT